MNFFIPKKLLLTGGGILILFLGILIGGNFEETQTSSPNVLQNNEPLYAGNIKSVRPPVSQGEFFKVVRVIDGDTIELENGERVRYIGIDTPETLDPRKPVECFGAEASKKNKELVEGRAVRLEKDITDRDEYNRLLRYVFMGDTFINLELVRQGFAHSYSYPPDVKRQEQFLTAEREARETKRGLWSGECDITTSEVVNFGSSRSDECKIKGNINTKGEKIYHLPDCASYSKTKIDESRNERWFCSEDEAEAAGWRRALNCP